MSHTLAARCTVCGVVYDPPCPECPGKTGADHGTTDQRPWSGWHADCLLADYDPSPGLIARGVAADPADHDPATCEADCCSPTDEMYEELLDAAMGGVVDVESEHADPSVEEYARAVLNALMPLIHQEKRRAWEEGRQHGESNFIQCPDDNPYRSDRT